MMDYFFEEFNIILEIESGKEVRVALGRWYLRPRLGHCDPRRVKFPVRSMSLSPKETLNAAHLHGPHFRFFSSAVK